MSPSPAAPSSASISACAITSPSEWPASPRGWSTRPRRGRAGRPSSSACASTPIPIRKSPRPQSTAPASGAASARPGASPRRVVTLSRRSSPATLLIRPPAASTSDAQSEPSPSQRPASTALDERLRRLHGDELVAARRLDDDPSLHALDRVGDRQRRHRAVEAFASASSRRARARPGAAAGPLVDEHDRRVVRHLLEPARTDAERVRRL